MTDDQGARLLLAQTKLRRNGQLIPPTNTGIEQGAQPTPVVVVRTRTPRCTELIGERRWALKSRTT
jgi:hypothetical protein